MLGTGCMEAEAAGAHSRVLPSCSPVWWDPRDGLSWGSDWVTIQLAGSFPTPPAVLGLPGPSQALHLPRTLCHLFPLPVEKLPWEQRRLLRWKMSSVTPNVVKQTVARSHFRVSRSESA